MISVDEFQTAKHYEMVCKWWEAQSWPIIPLSHLPQTGIIVSFEGSPSAVAWIYKTDSAFCLLEWITANPEIRREKRSSVLSALISSSKMIAKAMGFQSIFMSIKNQSLAKRIEPHGFAATDQGMTNYICDLSRRQ
jgi:hypothetical protein